MTGRYPFRYGLQKCVPQATTVALPLETATIPEGLKARLGPNVSTIALGKWHLGYASWRNTPTGRGFDHHRGYFQGEEDYKTKAFCSFTCILNTSGTGKAGLCGQDSFLDR